MTREEFQNDIRAGIPDRLPAAKPYDKRINHAPKRKDILSLRLGAWLIRLS